MPLYTEGETYRINIVNQLFEGPAEFDRLAIFDENAVWWNGLPHIGNPPGNTEHKGIAAIAKLMGGSGDRSNLDRGVDAYDLSTNRFDDIVVLADGDYVVRQHTQRSKTHGGRDYCNVYCFVIKFNQADKITYITEHWNTWYAKKFLLDNWQLEPAHPTLA